MLIIANSTMYLVWALEIPPNYRFACRRFTDLERKAQGKSEGSV